MIVTAAIEIGYSDTKVTVGDSSGKINKLFKFPSLIGEVKVNGELSEYVTDPKAAYFKGKTYYIGEDAMKLDSSALIDIVDYENLEYFAPIFVHHAIKLAGLTPSIIAIGLSISQVKQSGYFEDAVSKFTVNETNYEFDNIVVFPQGLACKLTVDKYGVNFPNKDSQFHQNYLGLDIGFNTLDIFRVIDGVSSTQKLEGIEGEGFIKIAKLVQEGIKKQFNTEYSLKEVNEIISDGFFMVKGSSTDVSTIISSAMNDYISNLETLIEDRFDGILKSRHISNMILFGGGVSLFRKYNKLDNFIIAPKDRYEYYNSIGLFLLSIKNL